MGEGGQKLRDVIYGRPLRKSERERDVKREREEEVKKVERKREKGRICKTKNAVCVNFFLFSISSSQFFCVWCEITNYYFDIRMLI